MVAVTVGDGVTVLVGGTTVGVVRRGALVAVGETTGCTDRRVGEAAGRRVADGLGDGVTVAPTVGVPAGKVSVTVTVGVVVPAGRVSVAVAVGVFVPAGEVALSVGEGVAGGGYSVGTPVAVTVDVTLGDAVAVTVTLGSGDGVTAAVPVGVRVFVGVTAILVDSEVGEDVGERVAVGGVVGVGLGTVVGEGGLVDVAGAGRVGVVLGAVVAVGRTLIEVPSPDGVSVAGG